MRRRDAQTDRLRQDRSRDVFGSHGKTVFNGAEEVHFPDNRELCEKEGNAQWVFLGHFSNSSIFMNTADKRLCFTDAKNYRLVSRKILENK